MSLGPGVVGKDCSVTHSSLFCRNHGGLQYGRRKNPLHDQKIPPLRLSILTGRGVAHQTGISVGELLVSGASVDS